MSDRAFRAYKKRRNQIAKQYGAVEIKAPVDWRGDHCICTDLRSDPGGLVLLDRFDAKLSRLSASSWGGPLAFADDGEAIVIWRGSKKDIIDRWKEKRIAERKRTLRYALFHPGYLPVRVPPKHWHALRVQNPNPTPYYNCRCDWLWTIFFDPGKIECDVRKYEFSRRFCGYLVTAEISRTDNNYQLSSPYVTSQKRMAQILADVAEYRRKLEIVSERYDLPQPPEKPGMPSFEVYHKYRKKLWSRIPGR